MHAANGTTERNLLARVVFVDLLILFHSGLSRVALISYYPVRVAIEWYDDDTQRVLQFKGLPNIDGYVLILVNVFLSMLFV